jgi:hypothetical protein
VALKVRVMWAASVRAAPRAMAAGQDEVHAVMAVPRGLAAGALDGEHRGPQADGGLGRQLHRSSL